MFKVIAKVWNAGGSLIITIPKDLAAFEGLELGDYVHATIRKENKNEQEETEED